MAAPEVVELASGIDALYLSGWAPVPSELSESLGYVKAMAQADSAPAEVDLAGVRFVVEPYAFGRYPYRLRCEHGLIGIAPESTLPPFRFQPLAEFLHGVGAAAAIEWFEALLDGISVLIDLGTARVDLHADFEGIAFDKHDDDRFVGQSVVEQSWGRSQTWTGFAFGAKGAPIYARIYDKSEELRRGRGGYREAIWGRGRNEGPAVVRIEFQLSSAALRSFRLKHPRDVLKAVGVLWHYLTVSWLTLRDRSDDATRSRWPIAGEWQTVQAASLADVAHGIARLKERSRAVSLEALTPALTGYLASYAALTGASSLDVACAELAEFVRRSERKSRLTFEARVAEKLRERS